VVAAVAPKPVNLLVGSSIGLTMREIAALGVRRVSVGGALARSAWSAFMRAATLIADEGRFDAFADAAAGRIWMLFFVPIETAKHWQHDVVHWPLAGDACDSRRGTAVPLAHSRAGRNQPAPSELFLKNAV